MISKTKLHDTLKLQDRTWNSTCHQIAIDIINHLQDRVLPELSSYHITVCNSRATIGSAPIKSMTPWKAPELFWRGAKPTKKSNIYAYGMILWELASKIQPFLDAPNDETMGVWILAGYRETIPKDCPPLITNIIFKCWSPNPEDRPTAKEILKQLSTTPTTTSKLEDPYITASALIREGHYTAALPCLHRSANKDHPPAFLKLGLIYKEKLNNPWQAEVFFRKAGRHLAWFKTHPHYLAICYQYGCGVKPNTKLANYWYQKSTR